MKLVKRGAPVADTYLGTCGDCNSEYELTGPEYMSAMTNTGAKPCEVCGGRISGFAPVSAPVFTSVSYDQYLERRGLSRTAHAAEMGETRQNIGYLIGQKYRVLEMGGKLYRFAYDALTEVPGYDNS